MRVLFLFICMASFQVSAQYIKNFHSDGCTYYPDGTKDEPTLWQHCCLEHDLRYWVGGDKIDQQISDLKLRQCVSAVSTQLRGTLMYHGVKLGHLSPIKSKYKWSWGWRHDKEFSALTAQEKKVALESISKTDINEEIKKRFIKENLSVD